MSQLAPEVRGFDEWSGTYDSHWSQTLLFGRIHRAVVDEVDGAAGGKPLALLDIGCGTGKLLAALGRRFPEASLAGVDPAPGMVQAAVARARDRATIRLAGASSLPFPDAAFTVVVSTSSFHHWEDQPLGLRETARVLAPRGVLVIADGYRGGLRRPKFGLLARALEAHHDDPAKFHNRAELRSLLQTAGLRVESSRRLWLPGIEITKARLGSA